jgi:hypothetical protein
MSVHAVDANQMGVTTMFAISQKRYSVQNVVCLLLAAVIVSASLACGALGVQSLESRAIAALSQAA